MALAVHSSGHKIKCDLQVQKVRRPKTRDLPSRKSANVKNEDISLAGRTGSHPATAENPAVPQPGLEPDLMSFRAQRPGPYNQ